MLQSAKLYVRGPVWIVGGIVSFAFTAVAAVQLIRDQSFWMWFCFAALALVGASFYSYHRSRVEAEGKAQELPQKIEAMIGEGLDLLQEARKPQQPTKEPDGTVNYSIGPDLDTADKADEFYRRSYRLLKAHQPSLVFDFVEEINASRKTIRERWEERQKRQQESASADPFKEDPLALFTEMIHQEPADFLEAYVHGLRAAKKALP